MTEGSERNVTALRDDSAQVVGVGKIFPGLASPSGSNANRSLRIVARSSGLNIQSR
ncbi:glutamate-1-semialdehyde aminotransferase [Synechococcus sp. RS9916]|nr:glutamate-1-semialdehyde aminotransferase [Synechococcus sp. RS9916]